MENEPGFESAEAAREFLQSLTGAIKENEGVEPEFLKKYTYCTDGLVSEGMAIIEEAIDRLEDSERERVSGEIEVIHAYLGKLAVSLGEPTVLTDQMKVGEVLANTFRNSVIEELNQLRTKTERRAADHPVAN